MCFPNLIQSPFVACIQTLDMGVTILDFCTSAIRPDLLPVMPMWFINVLFHLGQAWNVVMLKVKKKKKQRLVSRPAVIQCWYIFTFSYAASEAESPPWSSEEDLFHVDHHHLRHRPAHHRARARPKGPQRQHQTVPWNTHLQVPQLAWLSILTSHSFTHILTCPLSFACPIIFSLPRGVIRKKVCCVRGKVVEFCV